MNRLLSIAIICSLVFFGTACCVKKSVETRHASSLQINTIKTYEDTISYIIGSDIGKNFLKGGFTINPDILSNGIKSALDGNDTLFTDAQIQQIMTKFQKDMRDSQMSEEQKGVGENKEKGRLFLAENKKKEGVVELASGLQYKIIKEGNGESPKATDKVTVHYEGTLIDGTIFDSSYQRGETISFPLSGVIRGWTEGLQLMKTGSTYELYIPSDLAYGDRAQRTIPAGSTLIFKVELFSIESSKGM